MSLSARFWELMAYEGSTRGVGLLRIALATLLWTRWASELMPLRNDDPVLWAVAIPFYLGTFGMFFGIWTRVSTALTAATLAVMVGILGWFFGHHDWIHHHTTLLFHATVLLALTPCGKSFSVDRWLEVRRSWAAGEPAPPETGPLWAVPLIALQVSVVYFLSAIDKTTWRFLSGDHLRGIFAVHYTGSDPVEIPGYTALLVIGSVGVVALEYILPFTLFHRRTQRWWFAIGIVFHGLLYVLLPVGTFSMTMWALYLAYAHPDDVEANLATLLGRGAKR